MSNVKQDAKMFLPCDPIVFLLGVRPTEITPESGKDFHRKMFIEVLFITVKKLESHLKCSMMDESFSGKFT